MYLDEETTHQFNARLWVMTLLNQIRTFEMSYTSNESVFFVASFNFFLISSLYLCPMWLFIILCQCRGWHIGYVAPKHEFWMSCFFDVQDKFEINDFKLTPVYLVREMLLISSMPPFCISYHWEPLLISSGAHPSFYVRVISTFIIAHFQYLYSTLRYGITLKMMRIKMS